MDKATISAILTTTGVVLAGLVGAGLYAVSGDDEVPSMPSAPPPRRPPQPPRRSFQRPEVEEVEVEEPEVEEAEAKVEEAEAEVEEVEEVEEAEVEEPVYEEPFVPDTTEIPFTSSVAIQRKDPQDMSYASSVLFALSNVELFRQYFLAVVTGYNTDTSAQTFDNDPDFPPTCSRDVRDELTAKVQEFMGTMDKQGTIVKPGDVALLHNPDYVAKFVRLLYECPGNPQRRPERFLDQLFRVYRLTIVTHGETSLRVAGAPYYIEVDISRHANVTDARFKDRNQRTLSGAFGPEILVIYVPRVRSNDKITDTLETSTLASQVSHVGGVEQNYALLAVIVHMKGDHYITFYKKKEGPSYKWYMTDPAIPGDRKMGTTKELMQTRYNPNNHGVLFFYWKKR